MDKSDQPSPYRTPPWYCCSFENLVVIFSLLPSHTILPTNLPDPRGVPRWPEVPQVRTKHSAHGREPQEPRSHHCLEANILAPAPPARPPRWLWRGCDVEASVLHGHRHQQGLRPPRVPLAGGGELQFRRCPAELGGCRGRNSAGRGSRPSCRTGVTLLLQRRQNPAGQGAWPGGNCLPRTAEGSRHSLSISIQRHCHRAKEKATLVNIRRGDKST